MEAIICPLCGALNEEAQAGGACGGCGAVFSAVLLEQGRAEMASRGDGAPSGPLPGEDGDALVAAFRQQFEQARLVIPPSWQERLARLAAETEASRRNATVLFAELNLKHPGGRTPTLDEQDRATQWFFGVATRRVELHGGFVIRFQGLGVFAAFGAPWAFERDSESALQALLELREEVERKGQLGGFVLEVRAGANFGPVNVRLVDVGGQLRPELYGSTVNLAARMQSAAAPMEILITDTLAEQLEGVFEREARASFVPKNFDREVTPYAVLSHRGEEAVRRPHLTEFIGREKELAQLLAWAQEVLAGGTVAAELSGGAGVGKSRLLEELRAQLPQDFETAALDEEPHHQHMLLYTLLRLLHKLAALLDKAGTADSAGEKLRLLSALPGLPAEATPTLGYLLEVEPHAGNLRALPGRVLRAQVASVVVTLLQAFAAERRLLLLVDNYQWADPLSREVLETLARRRPPGLFLMVVRRAVDPLQPEQPDAAAPPQADAPWTQVVLLPLTEAEGERLLAQVVDLELLHPRLRERLVREAEGIPLYMIELARAAAQSDGERAEEERLELQRRAPSEVRLPVAIIEIMQARIDNLARQRRSLMQVGAVMGSRFSYGLISAFESLYEELLAELYALKGLQMLRDEPLPADIDFVFTPTVLREVVYHMMTPEQQAGLHRAVAGRLEEKFGTETPRLQYELAYHWTRAGESQRARRYLRRAAHEAITLGAPDEAYELLLPALVVDLPAAAERMDALDLQQAGLLEIFAAKAAARLGDFGRSAGHLENMLLVARRVGNARWEANALLQMATNAIDRGEYEEAARHVAAVEAIPDRSAALEAYLPVTRAILLLRQGRQDEALVAFEAAAKELLANPKLRAAAGDCWNNAGLVRWRLGQLEKAEHSFARALEIFEQIQRPFGVALCLSNLGMIAEKRGRFAQAEELLEKASTRASEVGYLNGISAIEANRSNLALLRRRWDAAEARAARSLHFARLTATPQSQAIALENLGLALGGRGLVDEAVRAFNEGAALAQAQQDGERLQSLLLAQAWVLLLNDRMFAADSVLAGLKGEVPGLLAPWRETLLEGVRLLRDPAAEPPDSQATLDFLREDATAEDYLRRLDVLELAATRRGSDFPALTREQLRHRRAAVFAAT